MKKVLKKLKTAVGDNDKPSTGQDDALDAYKDELEARWQVRIQTGAYFYLLNKQK